MPTYTSNTNNGYVLTLIVNEQSQNVENNQTVLSYQLNLSSGSAAYMTNITSQANITMDGSSIFSMNQQISIPNFNTTITLTSGTRTITHNADGTKSVPLSAWFETNNKYSYTPSGRLNLSGTMVLTTIPRASQPTLNVSTQNLGSAITISTNRASTAFTHTLKYTFGSLSANIATGVTASHAWTLPTSLGGQIPNTTSGTGSIICETYNGGTLIGTRTVSFTATVPNNTTFQPTVPALTVTDAATRPSGITSYVQTKARIRVQSSSTAQAGASISQYRVTILGTNYTGSDITTGVINTSGSVSILVRATDSRGYFREQTTSVTVVAYSPPQLTKYIATRSPNDQGTDLSTTISYSISPINNQNTKQYRIRYKRADLSTWTQLVSNTTSYALTDQANSATDVLSGDNSWNIEFMVKDSYAEVITIVNVGTAFELINFNASGKGIAFGKVSESDRFDVGMLATFRGDVTGPFQVIGSAADNPIRVRGISGITADGTAYDGLYLNFETGHPVYINGYTAWHAGNFSPSSKVDKSSLNPPSPGTTEIFVKLAALTINSNQGSNIEFILSGAGDHGNNNRGIYLVIFAQRNGSPRLITYGFNHEQISSGVPRFYYKSTGTYTFEVWARLARYNYTHQITLLNSHGAEVSHGSATSTEPTGLVYVPTRNVMANHLIRSGTVSISPTANSPSYVTVSFGITFGEAPATFATASTTVPGSSVTEVSTSNTTTTDTRIYIYKNTSTAIDIHWLAVQKWTGM